MRRASAVARRGGGWRCAAQKGLGDLYVAGKGWRRTRGGLPLVSPRCRQWPAGAQSACGALFHRIGDAAGSRRGYVVCRAAAAATPTPRVCSARSTRMARRAAAQLSRGGGVASKAALHGNADSQARSVISTSAAWASRRTRRRQADWYRQAAGQDDAAAAAALAGLYAKGRGVAQSYADAPAGMSRLRPPAGAMPRRRSPISTRRARRAARRRGAARWYEKAPAGRFAGAVQPRTFYAAGRGVTHDDSAAASWYRKAAEQGDLNAATTGSALCRRPRRRPDDGEAAFWYGKAAAPESRRQFNLGVMTRQGAASPRSARPPLVPRRRRPGLRAGREQPCRPLRGRPRRTAGSGRSARGTARPPTGLGGRPEQSRRALREGKGVRRTWPRPISGSRSLPAHRRRESGQRGGQPRRACRRPDGGPDRRGAAAGAAVAARSPRLAPARRRGWSAPIAVRDPPALIAADFNNLHQQTAAQAAPTVRFDGAAE